MLSRWFQIHLIRPLQSLLRSKWARLTAVTFTLFFVMPVAALAQNVTVRHRLYRHPKPFHRHDCEGCKSGCHRDRRLWFRTRRTRRQEGARRSCSRNRHCRSRGECPELALGRLAPFRAVFDPFTQHTSLGERFMAAKTQKHRTKRVFKSLHKPLTYLGVERTLFYFVCVGAVGAFNLFNSILAGIAVFIGGFAFGHWVTNSDPAFLRILARSERYKLRYDAAKQLIPRVEVL